MLSTFHHLIARVQRLQDCGCFSHQQSPNCCDMQGTLYEKTAKTCSSLLQSVLEGKTDELPARVCDVRDVARAHIRAIEDPSASGRHIISQSNNIPSQTVVNILKERFPQNSKLHGKDGDSSPIIDNSKVNHHKQCETLRCPHHICVSFRLAIGTALGATPVPCVLLLLLLRLACSKARSHIMPINTLTNTAHVVHRPSFADCMFTSSSRSDMLSQTNCF